MCRQDKPRKGQRAVMRQREEKMEKAVEKVKEIILSYIERNSILPWDAGLLNSFAPRSWTTKRKYRGVNQLMLGMLLGKSESQEFLTFNQIKKEGGKLKKGSHGCPILFYMRWDVARHCQVDEDTAEKDIVPLLRYSTVFAVEDCEGIVPKRRIEAVRHRRIPDVEAAVVRFARETNLTIENSKSGGTAYYAPSRHVVSIASLSSYKTRDAYYSTLFHEITHSTGKALGRKGGAFGGETYSKEEVVAECGAMLLCEYFGICKKERSNSAEYIRNWSEKLRDNPRWLISGMSQAEKAVAYFLEKSGMENHEEEAAEEK